MHPTSPPHASLPNTIAAVSAAGRLTQPIQQFQRGANHPDASNS